MLFTSSADRVASSAGTTATVRKSDRVFRKLNALALFSVPLLLVTLSRQYFESRLSLRARLQKALTRRQGVLGTAYGI